MNSAIRKIYIQSNNERIGILKKAEKALIKSASTVLNFGTITSSGATATPVINQSVGKAMPDPNKMVDWESLTHYNIGQVKVYGIMNVSASISDVAESGTVSLVYRQPGTNATFVDVPAVSVAIVQPNGLSADEKFAAEGSALLDMTNVPFGATIFPKVTAPDGVTLIIQSIDLKIEFKID